MTTKGIELFRKLGAGGLLFVAAFTAICTGRIYLDGKRHMERALELHRASETAGAFAEFEDAARAYFPGSPFSRQALIKMEIMAKSMQMRGHTDDAEGAFEKIRRAILSTRHVTQPNEDILKRVETSLVQLGKSGIADKTNNTQIARPKDPSPIFVLLLTLGLMAWIGGAAALCLTSKGPLAGIKGRGFLWPITLGGLVLWIVVSWISQ